MSPSRIGRALSVLSPRRADDRAALEPPADYTVVFPPTMLWSNHQRPHHVLTQLARHHGVRCLFNDWTVRWREHEAGRLIVTKQAFRARHHRGPFVYYYSIPEKLDYVRRHRLRPDLLVFELMDLPEEEFAGWKRDLPSALERSDLIRTTNPAITAYLREHYDTELAGKPITTSYNGVDLALFDPERAYIRPAELRGLEKPILGFYGNLDWWIDWALLARLARSKEWHVVVIGDTEGSRSRVPPELYETSIQWIDRRSVGELPAYLAFFDVALFPFVVNDMTDAVDPLKIWEYFAFGKPVIATRTAFVEERAHLFNVVDDDAVESTVAAALASRDDEHAVSARRAAAAERDWRVIAAELDREIRVALGARVG